MCTQVGLQETSDGRRRNIQEAKRPIRRQNVQGEIVNVIISPRRTDTKLSVRTWTAKSSKRFAVEKRKNVNQIGSGLILLNKPNTELSGVIRKKQRKVQAGFEPRSH